MLNLGRRHPSDEKLKTIAQVLKTPLNELKEYDTRHPWQELREATMSNPEFGFAFRRLVDSDVSPKELLRFLQERDAQEKRKG